MIVYGEQILDFARDYFKMPFERGVAIGFRESGAMQGVVVFDEYKLTSDGLPLSMEASVLVVDRRCVTRYNLHRLFTYCFAEVKLRSLVIRCGRREKSKRRLIERMGFRYEGIQRGRWPYGGDAVCFSMLPEECKWLALPPRQPRPTP